MYFKDCQAWFNEGMPLSTTNNECAKLYDAALTQLICWYDDASLGGISGTLDAMVRADPGFGLGRAIKVFNDINNGKTIVRYDNEMQEELLQLHNLAQCDNINKREKNHINAVKFVAEGNSDQAVILWDEIIDNYPNDPLAIYFGTVTHNRWLGSLNEFKNVITKSLTFWKPKSKLHGGIMGYQALCYAEDKMYTEAERIAKEAIDAYPHEAANAQHALAHVYEMRSETDFGVKLLDDVVKQWPDNYGKCPTHIIWHQNLFYVEAGQHEVVLEKFDNKEFGNYESEIWNTNYLGNIISLFHQIEQNGYSVGDRWNDVITACLCHIDDHLYNYHDLLFIIATLKGKKPELTKKFFKSIKDYALHENCKNANLAKEICLPIIHALIAFENENFEKVVKLMFPIKDKLNSIGHSDIAREVFEELFIESCIKSSNLDNNEIAKKLFKDG